MHVVLDLGENMGIHRQNAQRHTQKPGNKTGRHGFARPFCLSIGVLACLIATPTLVADVIRLPIVQEVSETSLSSTQVSIEQLQQMAMQTNPTLLQAVAVVQSLRGTQLQEGLYPNPSLGWFADEMGNGGHAGRQGISFAQKFVTADKLCLSQTAAARAVGAAEAQLRAQQRRVENDVRMTALSILAIQERIRILSQLVEISEDVVKTTEQLFKAKELSQADVLKAQIESNRTLLALQTASRNHHAAWQKLVGILGRPEMPQTTIEGTLMENQPQLTWEASFQKLLVESPQLEEVEAKIDQARWNLRRQCAERKPNLDVGGVVAYNDDTDYTEATLEVMVPLKIHDRNQGNIMRARAELMAAQQERDRLCLVLHNRLAQAFQDYKVAQVQVTAYRETLLPKSKTSLELTNQGFRESELSYLELLTAQRTFFSINLDYIDSLEHLWVSATEIEGLLLTGGLDSALQ